MSGKSDAELAALMGNKWGRKAGRAQINHWFTGRREPTINQLWLLCHVMEADPFVILFEEYRLIRAEGEDGEVPGRTPQGGVVRYEEIEPDVRKTKTRKLTAKGGSDQ